MSLVKVSRRNHSGLKMGPKSDDWFPYKKRIGCNVGKMEAENRMMLSQANEF
jgi:hypothetical protein